jgi:hypothetical protein
MLMSGFSRIVIKLKTPWYRRHKVILSFVAISLLLVVLGVLALLGYTDWTMDKWISGLSDEESFFDTTSLTEPPVRDRVCVWPRTDTIPYSSSFLESALRLTS